MQILELKDFVPKKQYIRRNSVSKTLGFDNTGKIDYCFDSIGFRTDASNQDLNLDCYDLLIFGSSISAGVGVEYQNSYSGLLGKNFNVKNLGFAGISYTNTMIYNLANYVLTKVKNKKVVVHWTSKIRDSADFEIYNTKLKLKSQQYFSLANEEHSTQILKTIDIYNFPFVDLCEYSKLDNTIPRHPGNITHRFFYKCINHTLTR